MNNGRRQVHGRLAQLSLLLSAAFLAGPLAIARAQTTVNEREVAGRAVASSPTLRAAVIDVQIARLEVLAAESDRGLAFFAGMSGSYEERLNATAEGVSANTAQRLSANLGVRDVTDWGMSLEAELTSSLRRSQVNRDPSTTSSVQIDPTYGADLILTARQPLLRGAWTGPRDAQLSQARQRRTASEHSRDDSASELLRQTLAAYWELWYAERAAAVQREALDLVTEQHRVAEIRANDLGTLAPSDLLRFASELATIEEALDQAEAQRRVRSMELGRLIGQRPRDAVGLATEDNEPPPAITPNLEQVLARALDSSALRALEAGVQAARSSAILADDNARTRLDLTVSLTSSGVWADRYFDFGVLPSNRPALSGLVGLELELPLGSSVAEAQAGTARARVAAAEGRARGVEREDPNAGCRPGA